jgi:hypothetical protein
MFVITRPNCSKISKNAYSLMQGEGWFASEYALTMLEVNFCAWLSLAPEPCMIRIPAYTKATHVVQVWNFFEDTQGRSTIRYFDCVPHKKYSKLPTSKQ